MIKIRIQKKQGKIDTIELSGHAGYQDYGRDIVCAGVSSILTTTVNAILSFGTDKIQIAGDNPFLLRVLKADEITTKLLGNMISLFQEMEEAYPKNITIREDETNE